MNKIYRRGADVIIDLDGGYGYGFGSEHIAEVALALVKKVLEKKDDL